MPEHDTVAGLARGPAAGGGSHQQLLQQQQQSQPLVGDQLCLDKTFLLDTVVKMDPEALQVGMAVLYFETAQRAKPYQFLVIQCCWRVGIRSGEHFYWGVQQLW